MPPKRNKKKQATATQAGAVKEYTRIDPSMLRSVGTWRYKVRRSEESRLRAVEFSNHGGGSLPSIAFCFDCIRPVKLEELDNWVIRLTTFASMFGLESVYHSTFPCSILWFNLADVTEDWLRNDMRRLISNFDSLYEEMDALYTHFEGNLAVKGGLILVWFNMCLDGHLRDKLFQRGLLPRMLSMLEDTSARPIFADLFNTTVRAGGLETRLELIKHLPTLVRIVEHDPDDDGMSALTHSLLTIFMEKDIQIDKDLPKLIDVAHCATAMLNGILHHNVSCMALPGVQVLCGLAHSAPLVVESMPEVLTFIAALTRVNNIEQRCRALRAFRGIYGHKNLPAGQSMDFTQLFSASTRPLPSHLKNIMDAYGFDKCEMSTLVQLVRRYCAVVRELVKDTREDKKQALCELGRAIFDLNLYEDLQGLDPQNCLFNEETGEKEVVPESCLPFSPWSNASIECANALQGLGNPDDVDVATSLAISYFHCNKILQTFLLAREASRRNPNFGYYYLVLSWECPCLDLKKVLLVKQAAKAKSPNETMATYLKLLAIESEMWFGINSLCSLETSRLAEGIAFLTSAFEEVTKILDEAPPDCTLIERLATCYLMLSLALKGHELSLDLTELLPVLKKVEVAREICEHYGTAHLISRTDLIREPLLSHLSKAASGSSNMVERCRRALNLGEEPERQQPSLQARISAVREELERGTYTSDRIPRERKLPSYIPEQLGLQICAHCSNRSIMLKKCAGCGKVFYCGPRCQKADWPEHKPACKSARAHSSS